MLRPLEKQPEELPSPEQWDEFVKHPCWKAMVEEMTEAKRRCMVLLCSNEALKTLGRDNFPEVKFERGRLFSIETFLDLPFTLQLRAQEEKNDRTGKTKVGGRAKEGAGGSGKRDA